VAHHAAQHRGRVGSHTDRIGSSCSDRVTSPEARNHSRAQTTKRILLPPSQNPRNADLGADPAQGGSNRTRPPTPGFRWSCALAIVAPWWKSTSSQCVHDPGGARPTIFWPESVAAIFVRS
jgi:hypothetical protein